MPRAPAAAGWRALLALQVVVVGWLAFDPRPPTEGLAVWDKLQHAGAFAVMAITAILALPGRPAGAGLGLLAYGAFIELVQTFIPGRSGEWADLLADAVGVALGLALARTLRRKP